MNRRFRNFFALLWSRPDPVLAQAAVAGELLVAKVRLGLATLLLLIPLLDSLFFPVERKEALVGIGLTGATFLVALVVYFVISREYNPVVQFCQHQFRCDAGQQRAGSFSVHE
jgi:hypothetical protein